MAPHIRATPRGTAVHRAPLRRSELGGSAISDLDLAKASKEELELAKLRIEVQKAQQDLTTARLHYAMDMADRETRGMFHLSGSIDTHLANRLANDLDAYCHMNPGGDVEIHIHSPGGSVFSGFAIYDRLMQARAQGHHVYTIAYGYAASMAGILLQAGTTRIMSRDAYLMIHEVSTVAIGKVSELTDETKLVNRLQDRSFEKLAERSKLSAKQIRGKCSRKDWWLDAEEALANGFIDEIRGAD